jgi:[ribosomal protein S18]-alanine N-acetyltransferase
MFRGSHAAAIMQLRSYRASDFDALHQIDQACFPPGVSYSREELAEFIDHRNSATWVAEGEGEIAGFLVAGREPQRVGHIITIDVVACWRRRGVGSALMSAAEDWAARQQLRLLYLETAQDNVPAQPVYAGRGYEKLRMIERYYSNGAAAWVMVKWLGKQSKVES